MMRETATFGRRHFLTLAGAGFTAAGCWNRANPRTITDAPSIAPVRGLHEALLTAMRAGARMSFAERFASLAPVIDRALDLDDIVASAIGPRWSALPNDQKQPVGAAFRCYTVASYAANFNSYSGQIFEMAFGTHSAGNGAVVVPTRLVSADGSSDTLDYVMRDGQAGWKAVDVMAAFAVSRVAVLRSDFHVLLTNGGLPALVAALQSKVVSLSGSMST